MNRFGRSGALAPTTFRAVRIDYSADVYNAYVVARAAYVAVAYVDHDDIAHDDYFTAHHADAVLTAAREAYFVAHDAAATAYETACVAAFAASA